MTDEKTNKERLDSINTKLDNIINSLENKAGVTQGTTLKNLLDNTKSAQYLFYKYHGTSVDDLISYDDTSSVIFANNMFSECTSLTSIPLLNTNNVTDMHNMFEHIIKITTIPLLNTSKVTNMNYLFNNCSKLTTIPQLETSNVTAMNYMFGSCGELTDVPLLNTKSVRSMTSMFTGCNNKLITVPAFNTSSVTNMQSMFYQCSKLKVVPAFSVGNVTNMSSMFTGCTALEEIHMYGMKISFTISSASSSATKFTREALVEILNNLATVTASRTLTMGSTNLAKLTDEDKAIATAKGWTLA